jgi:hypothetical protein
MSLEPFLFALPPPHYLPLLSHCSVLILFLFCLVAVLLFSCHFVVGPTPTPWAVTCGSGWGSFHGPVSGHHCHPDVVLLLYKTQKI